MRKLAIAALTLAAACNPIAGTDMKDAPDFRAALDRHLAAIEARDLDAFKASVTTGDTLMTIVQNGHAFMTPAETIAMHEDWFKRSDWSWKGEVVRTIIGKDVAAAIIRYDYQDTPEAAPFSTWLTLVFQIEDGEWRLVHDQNTMISEAEK